MGIKHLNKIIKKYSPDAFKTTHLSHYAFKRVAIDVSLFMFKYKTVFGEDRWLTAFVSLICCLRRNEVHPVFIFDSKAPPEKLLEQQERREARNKIKEKLEKLEVDYNTYKDSGEVSDFLKEESKKEKTNVFLLGTPAFRERVIKDMIDKLKLHTISIGRKDFLLAKELFSIMSIPYYQATTEAEATAAYLCKEGIVHGVVSEDTDVLAYASPKFMTKINIVSETCMEIDYNRILLDLEMTPSQFLDMCIMCGTDYNKNIPKIGPQKAYQLIKKHGSLDKIKEETDLDTSVLKFERGRELFTFKEDYFTEKVVFCGEPNFNMIDEFLFKHNCRINMDYVRKCFKSLPLEFK